MKNKKEESMPEPGQGEQPMPSSPSAKKGMGIGVVILIGVLSALVAGAGTYFATASLIQSQADRELSLVMDEAEGAMDSREMEARDRIAVLEERIIELEDEAEAMEEDPLADLVLPVVVYERKGLLTGSESGQADIEEIERKLINPMHDYYNEERPSLLTLDIVVPTEVGEAYEVTGIFASGVILSFLYSERETSIDWWLPECGPIGDCGFSDSFREKYPEIVSSLE